MSWPLLWCCVFSPCIGHAPCLSLCLACHSTAHTWPESAHQLPFRYTWFPCSRLQIVLRYTVVVIRTWLQSVHFLIVVSPAEISCFSFVLFAYSFVDLHLQHACFTPSSLIVPTLCPPASLLVTPYKPVHLHSNSCPLSVFCSWVQQLSLP